MLGGAHIGVGKVTGLPCWLGAMHQPETEPPGGCWVLTTSGDLGGATAFGGGAGTPWSHPAPSLGLRRAWGCSGFCSLQGKPAMNPDQYHQAGGLPVCQPLVATGTLDLGP